MKELKPIDYELLFELMKDSRRSDRTLAKVLGISQPTVTRRRAYLEKYFIDGYTAIPKWKEIGCCLLAMTFVKIKSAIATREQYAKIRKRGLEWLMNQPNITMAGGCRGMGVESFMISVHETYTDYDNFMRNYRLEWGDCIDTVDSVLVNLCGDEVLKPLHFKYLTKNK